MNKPKADLTPEELEEREKHEFQTGPLSVLTESVRNNTQVLINCRNNRKLMARVKVSSKWNAYYVNSKQGIRSSLQYGVGECEGDVGRAAKRHQRFLSQYSDLGLIPTSGKQQPVNRDRYISKMFLRGDSVIIVLKNPLEAAK